MRLVAALLLIHFTSPLESQRRAPGAYCWANSMSASWPGNLPAQQPGCTWLPCSHTHPAGSRVHNYRKEIQQYKFTDDGFEICVICQLEEGVPLERVSQWCAQLVGGWVANTGLSGGC